MAKKGSQEPLSLNDIAKDVSNMPIPREEIERMRREIRAINDPWQPISYRYNPPNIDWNAAQNITLDVNQPIYATTNSGVTLRPYYEEAQAPTPTKRFWIVYAPPVGVYAKVDSYQEAIDKARVMANQPGIYSDPQFCIMECKGWVVKEDGETRYIQAPIPEEAKSE